MTTNEVAFVALYVLGVIAVVGLILFAFHFLDKSCPESPDSHHRDFVVTTPTGTAVSCECCGRTTKGIDARWG